MPSYSGIFTLQTQMQAKAASNWPSPPPTIGDAYGGGFYAGQIGVSGVATHNLVVGPVSSAQSTNKKWKVENTSTSGTSSVINGPANSAAMNNADHPAAQFCEAVNVGGFSDWYMPAKNELEICYYNLKPTTTSNSAWGINPNAVPARASNYTSGTPAQTSASAFQSGGSEAFTATDYWSSTQYDPAPSYAYPQNFSTGSQGGNTKNYALNVRAIRRVAV